MKVDPKARARFKKALDKALKEFGAHRWPKAYKDVLREVDLAMEGSDENVDKMSIAVGIRAVQFCVGRQP